jgi:Secretion system C-terminal sorting domain/PKD-like domain
MHKQYFFFGIIFTFCTQSLFSQLNIKVKVTSVSVLSNVDCDGFGLANSDFLFEFKATDNSPLALTNNSPVVGSIGNCNYVSLPEVNGPYILTPTSPAGAVFFPTTGVFFDRNYNCKKDIPTQLQLTWRAYENDDVTVPSIIPVANGTTAIQTNSYTVPLTNGSYTVQYSATSLDGGCLQTYQIVFTVVRSVVSFPPLSIVDGDPAIICFGATNGTLGATIVGGSGTLLYDWSNDGLSDYDDNPSVTGLGIGTYTFVVKDALNCTDTIVLPITSINPPIPLGSFTSASATVCAGQNNVLYAVPSQSVSYSWAYSGSGAAISGSTQSVSINFLNTATSGVLSVYAQNSCSVTPTLTMNISVIAMPTIIISGNTSMCNNTQEILTASGATSYTWNTGVTSSSITITPSVTSIYSVTGVANGCSSTKQFTMGVLPSPTVQISGATATICPNQTVTLTASGNGNLFIWSDGYIGAIHTVTVPSTGIFTITNTFTNSCFGQNTFTVNVHANPILAINGNTIVCPNKTTTLTATGATNYSWSSGQSVPSITLSPTGFVSYTVTGTNSITTCSATKTITVNVFLPSVVSIVGNTMACSGATNVYTVTGSNFYLWNNGATANTNTINPTASTTISVVGTTTNGCKDSTLLALTITANLTLTVNGIDSICLGQSALITANAIGASSYSWNTGTTSSTLNVTPSSTTVYTVTATNNGCYDTKTHQVVVKTIPSVSFPLQPTICTFNPVLTLSATPTGGTYSGLGVTGNTFDPSIGAGIYTITYLVVGSNGCESSKTQTIRVDVCDGIKELEARYAVSIYPNPIQEFVNIKSEKNIRFVFLYDYTGKFIESHLLNTKEYTIPLAHLASGIYSLVFKFEDGTVIQKKIIKE